LVGKLWDNLWAICGSAVQPRPASRMVVQRPRDMPQMPDEVGGFYLKMSLAREIS
jgi:hypothetical protein